MAGLPGTLRKCSRCKGTGQARFNHLNGDTHCYLCNGSGIQRILSKDEKAREEDESQWLADNYQPAFQFDCILRRQLGSTSPMRKALGFWGGMVMGRSNIPAAEAMWAERDEADRAERRAFAETL
jgi:hypothetical protein